MARQARCAPAHGAAAGSYAPVVVRRPRRLPAPFDGTSGPPPHGTARPPAPAPPACRPRRHPLAGPRCHPPAGPSGARFRIGLRRRCCSMARRARCAVIRHRVWHEAREVRVEFFALRLSRAGNRRTSPCFDQEPSHIGHHVPRGIAGYRTSGTTCQGGPLAAAHRRPRAKEPHEVPQAAAFVPKKQARTSYHQGGD